jgi:hypothetical protein
MKEKRWLIVAQDGRHVTVGRYTDPAPEEIERAGLSLDEIGTAGWLVVSEGIYHSDGAVALLMVRRITERDGNWSEAEQLWHSIRAGRQ